MTAPEDDLQQQQQQQPRQSNGKRNEADLAQAYKEIMRGEQAATAMENNLTNLESKLDAILAAFDTTEVEKATSGDRRSPDGENRTYADQKTDKKGDEHSSASRAENQKE